MTPLFFGLQLQYCCRCEMTASAASDLRYVEPDGVETIEGIDGPKDLAGKR